jgi:hypothetical protein
LIEVQAYSVLIKAKGEIVAEEGRRIAVGS